MVKGDMLDYFGLSGYSTDQLKKMGYAVWMPVQEKGSWLGEGDNHTFMNMLGNGLRAYEVGWYGGWGGRVVSNREVSAPELAYPNFFPQAQRDFAARLKWSVTTQYPNANHEPVVKIEGPLTVLASPGEKIRLNGAVSDPDGNAVSIRWWQFQVGSYPNKVVISNPDSAQAEVLIPNNAAAGQTIHLILEAADHGTPSLTRYQQMIITVREK